MDLFLHGIHPIRALLSSVLDSAPIFSPSSTQLYPNLFWHWFGEENAVWHCCATSNQGWNTPPRICLIFVDKLCPQKCPSPPLGDDEGLAQRSPSFSLSWTYCYAISLLIVHYSKVTGEEEKKFYLVSSHHALFYISPWLQACSIIFFILV